MDNKGQNKTNINWYPGHMAKTKRELKMRINLIDIIYEVIDARMPASSKMKGIDDILRDKPRIIVMTKKDLCDMSVTEKWVNYYESLGNIVILADLTNDVDYKELIKVTKKIMEPVQEKRRKQGLKEKEIKIGVVGIPNVGKSTLINKLARKKVAKTGNKPGVTTSINWLKTDCGFLLLDTPGILWPNLDEFDDALPLAATATIKTEILNMTDIGGYIITFLKSKYPEKLVERYNIELSDDLSVLFDNLAKRFNAYTKDGLSDLEKVCVLVYNDIVSSAIKGVTFDPWIEK